MVEKWIGKNAVVTGCASGIGLAIFKDLVRSKINVIGLDVTKVGVDELIGASSTRDVEAHVLHCNVAVPDSVQETFRRVEEIFGVLHILVNCAGIGR